MNTIRVGSKFGPRLASGYVLKGIVDFNGDHENDYLLYNPTTQRTAGWYLHAGSFVGSAYGTNDSVRLAADWSRSGLHSLQSDNSTDGWLVDRSQHGIWWLVLVPLCRQVGNLFCRECDLAS